MQQLLLIIHVLAAIAIVSLVLLQQGKGSDVGAAFGSGASNTMFGSQGALPFLLKLTVFLVAVFFATSIGLARLTALHTTRALSSSVSQQSPVPSLPVTQSLPLKQGAITKPAKQSSAHKKDNKKTLNTREK